MIPPALPPIPPRMARLPLDARGYPVPWFVPWTNSAGELCAPGIGTPDFSHVEAGRIATAVAACLCWICGDRLGSFKTFVVGPMCAITRVTNEPPSHRECAEFAACACPFLTRPKMRRSEDTGGSPGVLFTRNPGVALVWTTRKFHPFQATDGAPGMLFRVGAPDHVRWYAEGRLATRQEAIDSLEGGYALLLPLAETDGPRALADAEAGRIAAMALVPEAPP